MLNGCVTSKSSSSSPASMVSPSSLHSSPQPSSTSFGHDRSPVSSPSRANFPSVPLIKPSAIKDSSLSVHFPASTMSSMCFPLHAIYAAGQNPYSGMNNNFSSLFSPHAIARQMSFLSGNSFSQSIAGKRIPGEEFSRFPPVFASVPSSAHRSQNVAGAYHPTPKQSCIFPFNTTHSSASHLHHGQTPNMFNSIPTESPSPPPFKRRMLSMQTDCEIDHSAPSDASAQGTSLSSHNWCRRSPSEPLSCPLCSIALEGVDINNHFYEEVHKVETLRKLNDWAYNSSKECSGESDDVHQFESRSSSYEKKLPYSRWETFQRVKQNRHSRLTALVRQTKRKFESEDPIRSGNMQHHDDRIWSVGSNISIASSQKHDDDDSSSEKNVDVVSDLDNSDTHEKGSECEERSEEDHHTPHQRLRNTEATNEENGNRSDGENGILTDGKEIKTLENGLTSESEIAVNSENNENVLETIDTLRKRIRELENKENDSNNNEPLCFICSNSFTKPVVSVSCWHVHCEQCWIQIVDSKRLCPQCDAVVTSRDLRRVLL